ncbi:TPA: acyltransferase [Vibrio parahaemolyticus]|uniref:acyltransferase family protein n=1 Tax=Vibrio TaxID=662 RepID=UPI001B834DC3|nr:acyltransferase [Vibrio sp. Vb2976]MDF4719610.1 acyltransferase [Vibrio parahaemolyticus]MDW1644325.1 acyltransferase [Vibrio sp. Vb2976]HBC3894926.1 acyltransferase [Vibrio parahaemolyticus]HCE2428313.1 acyltransferase [Vibrio parahaemolyticus]HCE2485750.1 acyltransferase [Vibrio parahaemolyticus]
MNEQLINTKKRYENLDLLRGLAALSVLLYHYLYHYSNIYDLNYGIKVFALGKFGVVLFFVLSGFVIFTSLNNGQSRFSFVKKRFLRLFPTYWICISLTFIITTFYGLPGREVDFQTYIVNLTMLQNLIGVRNVDGVYWTLTYELLFYMFSCVFLFRKNNVRKFFAINIAYMLFQFSLIFSEVDVNIRMKTMILYEYYVFFLVGMIFYFDETNVRLYSSWHLQILLLLSLIYIVLVRAYPFIDILCIAFVYLGIKKQNIIPNGLIKRILLSLGGVSYPLYLLHQNIGFVVIRNASFSFYVNCILAMLLSIALSLVVLKLETKLRVINK